MNYVIRAAKPGDLQSIYEMAKLTGGGFTNLPPDKKALRAKLERAEAGFASEKEYPADELYLMMLEDLDSGEVRESAVGTLAAASLDLLGCGVQQNEGRGGGE